MTDKPGITLTCFGLIGTLVADEGVVERSFAEAIATQGVVSGTSAFAHRMAQVHQARGRSADDVMRLLFPDNQARAQAAQLAFDRALADAVGRQAIRPVPGAVRVLGQLHAAGISVCVLTSLRRRLLELVLDAAALAGHVDLALSADDVPRGFPAPDLVLMSMLRTGAGSIGEVAVIDDNGAGVEGGRRSGAGIVAGVLTGPHPARRLRSAGATQILESVAELPALVIACDAGYRPAAAGAENGTSGRMKSAEPEPPGSGQAKGPSIDVPAQVPFERRTSER